MGNKNSEPQFHQLMANLKSQKYAKKISIRPQQKYKNQMLQVFQSSNLPTLLKDDVKLCIIQKIDKADLISTVSVISTLMKNNFSTQAFKSTINASQFQNKQVLIHFNGLKIKNAVLQKHKKYDKVVQDAISELLPSEQQQKKQKSYIEELGKRIAFTQRLLRKQICKEYHPFNKLNKIFADFLVKIFLTQQLTNQQLQERLNPQLVKFLKTKRRSLKKSQKSYNDDDQYEQLARKLIHLWCQTLNQACLKPYKKWVLYYTQMPEKKYHKMVMKVLTDEIWAVNDNYLFQIIGLVIENYKPKLKISGGIINEALVTPALFQIDQPLQIEGHYLYTIHDIFQFPSIIRPTDIIDHLNKIKNSICNDIDKYHHLQQKLFELSNSTIPLSQSKVKPVYQINSDNIIGIVNFILFRVREKIQQIDRQCIFLRIIYDDKVYFSFEQSSYMLSTLISAMQFLDGEGFKDLIRSSLQKDDKKNTNVTNMSSQKSKQIDLIESQLSLSYSIGMSNSNMFTQSCQNQLNESSHSLIKQLRQSKFLQQQK